MMRILSVLALLLLTLRPAAAQTPPPVPGGEELLDRVVAVVGDTSLLLSELRSAVQQVEATSGQPIPTDPVQRDAFMNAILEDRINSLLLVQAARDAGLTADEAQVQESVEAQIRQVLQSFNGSQQRLEAALAADQMTIAQYRETLAQQFRDDQLARSYMAERMRARARPVISEDEIRAAFEAQKARLGTRPEYISFSQVIVKPQAGDSADAVARRTAEDVLQQLRAGGDWEVLARRFSDDPGTKEVGGDLGWVRQDGTLVKEFEEVVFGIRPRAISPIVTTEFGYHILQVQATQGAERQVRHILISPEISAEDIERARTRADSVANAIRGGANVAALARAYGTRQEEITVSPRPVPDLPPAYAEALAEASTAEVVGPFEVPAAGTPSWAVARVDTREPAREYSVADVREQLVQRLQEERMVAQIVEDLRTSIFVAVTM